MTRLADIEAAIDLAADYGIISELPAGDGIVMDWNQGIDGRGCWFVIGDGKLTIYPPHSPTAASQPQEGK